MTENIDPKNLESRPTITIALPSGWALAALMGAAAALLGWAVPVLLASAGFWLEAQNPWVTQSGWQQAVTVGSGVWGLSLGANVLIGGIFVSLTPLLWTFIEIVILRAMLAQVRKFLTISIWASVPAYVAVSATLLLTITPTEQAWAGILGSLLVAAVGSLWATLAQAEKYPQWMKSFAWLWSGFRSGLWWALGLAFFALAATAYGYFVNRAMISASIAEVGVTGLSATLFGIFQLIFLPLILSWALAGMIADWSGNASELGLPLLDIIPGPESWGSHWLLTLAFGVLLGAVTGWRLRDQQLWAVLQRLAVAVATVLAVWAIVLNLSVGSLGDNRLSDLGPAWLPVIVSLLWQVILPAVLMGLLMNRSFRKGTLVVWGRGRRWFKTAVSARQGRE